MIRRPPRSTQSRSSAASDVYQRAVRIPPRNRYLSNLADTSARAKARSTLYVDSRQPIQPRGKIPVEPSQESHARRHHHHPHYGGVEQDGHGQPKAHLLDHHQSSSRKGREDDHHDKRSTRDYSPGLPQSHGYRLLIPPGLIEVFTYAAEEEDVVVHAESKKDAEEEHRHPGFYGRGVLETQNLVSPTLLEDQNQHAVGRTHGYQCQIPLFIPRHTTSRRVVPILRHKPHQSCQGPFRSQILLTIHHDLNGVHHPSRELLRHDLVGLPSLPGWKRLRP